MIFTVLKLCGLTEPTKTTKKVFNEYKCIHNNYLELYLPFCVLVVAGEFPLNKETIPGSRYCGCCIVVPETWIPWLLTSSGRIGCASVFVKSAEIVCPLLGSGDENSGCCSEANNFPFGVWKTGNDGVSMEGREKVWVAGVAGVIGVTMAAAILTFGGLPKFWPGVIGVPGMNEVSGLKIK